MFIYILVGNIINVWMLWFVDLLFQRWMSETAFIPYVWWYTYWGVSFIGTYFSSVVAHLGGYQTTLTTFTWSELNTLLCTHRWNLQKWFGPSSSKPENGYHSGDDIFECILWNENCCINWGGKMHICITSLTIIVLDNGLLPGRRQVII